MTVLADITPEMADLLRAGAADAIGIVCRPGQVQKNWSTLRELQRLGYVRFPNIEQPWITEAGRRAIGAPSQAEADRARFLEMCSRARKPLVPAKRDDPRTDFDYRSYRSMGWLCTLLIRQPDHRYSPATIRVGRTLRSEPQFLGAKNAIILPESVDRFVLAIVPKWLIRVAVLPTYPMPLDETDPEFTDDERATWDRLRQVCVSVNARIQRGARSPQQQQKYRYGENA